MRNRLLSLFGPLLGLSLFFAALWVLHRATAAYHYRDLADAVRSLPTVRITAALLLTVLNFAVLTGYDSLAFRYVGRTLAYPKIAFASFIGYAFSNTIGLSLLAGSAVRYRLYSSWGVSTVEITKMVAFYTLTLWLGILALGGAVFTAAPVAVPGRFGLPFLSARPLGILFLLITLAYLVLNGLRRRPLTVGGHEIPVPDLRLSLAQIGVASLDWLLAGSVLFVLLPLSPHDLPLFLGAYLMAQVAGLVSQVPGGLGVFESVMLLLLRPDVPAPQVIGALLVYRLVYYLFPLALAALLLGLYELARIRTQTALLLRFIGQSVPAIAPRLFGVLTFAAGALLLFSGATPAVPVRLSWLNEVLPLPLLEVSHFLGSLVGAALLLLSWGIGRRLDAAYHAAVVLLGAGAVFSLAKGLDYEEALLLSVLLVALLMSRRYFYRPTSLLGDPLSPSWLAAAVAALAGSVWLGLFAYRHVDYSQELWWRFTLHGDAPRFLRASVGGIALLVIVAVVRLLRPPKDEPSFPVDVDLDRVRAVVRDSSDTTAHLALLGDKRLLWSESGRSFVMYGKEGRSWVAMGDPVGAEEERRELVWSFHELCDRHGGWTIFYEADAESLPLYLDLGLTPLKIGEEARVPLEGFSLEGSGRKSLRYARTRMEREGAVFSIVPVEGIAAVLPELRAISDAWLAEKNTREKRFSLGSFSEPYLLSCPAAVVKKNGAIIAFANLWPGGGREELSVDLMRFRPDAPRGMMEYLFVELMLWGSAQGYRWFNLGMVPLAGLEDRALAPFWSRLGARVFRHGEHFYNFQGLRQFKEHFDPQWRPKYLISPGGFALPRILTNLAALISGGLKGAISK